MKERPPTIGWFYIVQVLPELVPNRLKFGFTRQLERRMQQYRYLLPTARVLGSWQCNVMDELPLIAALTADGCTRPGPGSEMFDVPDVEATVRAAAVAVEEAMRERRATRLAKVPSVFELVYERANQQMDELRDMPYLPAAHE